VSSKLIITVAFLIGLFTPDPVFDSTQQHEFVAAHNRWRKEVGAPPLKWSPALASMAQGWADHLKEANGCKMVHSHSDFGENLHWAGPMTWSSGKVEAQVETPADVVDSWASEKQDYNHRSNSCARGRMCGHYTQLVWRNTTQVGCGRAVCKDLSQVWVCNYQPAGNYLGQKPY
jgi:pathogenesis-related protein 1